MQAIAPSWLSIVDDGRACGQSLKCFLLGLMLEACEEWPRSLRRSSVHVAVEYFPKHGIFMQIEVIKHGPQLVFFQPVRQVRCVIVLS